MKLTSAQQQVIDALKAGHTIRRRLGNSWTHIEKKDASLYFHPLVRNSTVEALFNQGKIFIDYHPGGWGYLVLKEV